MGMLLGVLIYGLAVIYDLGVEANAGAARQDG